MFNCKWTLSLGQWLSGVSMGGHISGLKTFGSRFSAILMQRKISQEGGEWMWLVDSDSLFNACRFQPGGSKLSIFCDTRTQKKRKIVWERKRFVEFCKVSSIIIVVKNRNFQSWTLLPLSESGSGTTLFSKLSPTHPTTAHLNRKGSYLTVACILLKQFFSHCHLFRKVLLSIKKMEFLRR